jgi:hypothetical protein
MIVPNCAKLALGCTLLELCIAACTVTPPRLSESEVGRIADVELRKLMTIDLRQYHRSAPTYVRGEHAWLVPYARKNGSGPGPRYIGAEIDDITRKFIEAEVD